MLQFLFQTIKNNDGYCITIIITLARHNEIFNKKYLSHKKWLSVKIVALRTW